MLVEVEALGVVATGLGGEWINGLSAGTSVSIFTKTKIRNYKKTSIEKGRKKKGYEMMKTSVTKIMIKKEKQ